jgi:hypothetical protein
LAVIASSPLHQNRGELSDTELRICRLCLSVLEQLVWIHDNQPLHEGLLESTLRNAVTFNFMWVNTLYPKTIDELKSPAAGAAAFLDYVYSLKTDQQTLAHTWIMAGDFNTTGTLKFARDALFSEIADIVKPAN